MTCVVNRPVPSWSVLSIVFLLLLTLESSCSHTGFVETIELADVTPGTGLLIGCVVFEQRNLQDAPLTAVLGVCDQEGNWAESMYVTTDSLGFFAQEVPPGEYWIGAVRTDESKNWSVSYYYSSYRARVYEDREDHWTREDDLFTSMTGRGLDKTPSTHRVVAGDAVDLGYLVLKTGISRIPGTTPGLDYLHGIAVRHDALQDQEEFAGEAYYHQRVSEYFMRKYPSSEWVPSLKELTRGSQMRQR